MIAPELHAEIRRLFYAEHWRIDTIADQPSASITTPSAAPSRASGSSGPGTQVRPSALDPYKAFITATLEQYPRLRATRLWAMLRERGYPGSADPGPALRPHRAPRRPRRGLSSGSTRSPASRPRSTGATSARSRSARGPRVLSCFVLVLVLVARRLRALRPRPDARELPARPRRGLRRPAAACPAPSSTTT